METWQVDFEWLHVQHIVQKTMGKKEAPDLQGVLFLIGIQELGLIQQKFSKEEKQDLIHIAVCKLLSYDGYYVFKGRDEDGWPHYDLARPIVLKQEDQDDLLKRKVIEYFKDLEKENGGFSNI
ncbi:MAG: hypothetical protein OEQ53_03465 [Saprospiraceae bacterium]|nr:hypothetical protein [Saprospiraceae bacterium]